MNTKPTSSKQLLSSSELFRFLSGHGNDQLKLEFVWSIDKVNVCIQGQRLNIKGGIPSEWRKLLSTYVLTNPRPKAKECDELVDALVYSGAFFWEPLGENPKAIRFARRCIRYWVKVWSKSCTPPSVATQRTLRLQGFEHSVVSAN
jgi:hypothetical protein